MEFWADIFSAYENPFSIWQILGWLAVPIYLLSYQLLNPKHTMAAHIPADILYTLHFFGLGAILPALIAGISPLRNVLGIFGSQRSLYLGLLVFTIYAWVCGFIVATDLLMFLPVLATTFKSIAILCRHSFWKYRFFLLLFQLLYLTVFIYIGSYAGTFLSTITLSSNLIGLIRYHYKPKIKDANEVA